MNILGIETSCDETAVAIVDESGHLHANLVLSQLQDHKIFGGVVPEIAARAHIDHLHTLIAAAMNDAGMTYADLHGVAATSGPGLIGGVMIGMVAGKAIAAAHNLPFMAVNHLEGHALTARLTDKVDFPFLLLLVSGGHTQILVAEGVDRYKLWGTTIDDAAGECFDKSAKLMGLPYPGGPEVQKIAAECNDHAAAIERFPLPRPLVDKFKSDLDMLDFSFSGLKTAVRTHIDALPEGDLSRHDIADLAYAFQTTMADIISMRADKALMKFSQEYGTARPSLVVAGGVAANSAIRERLSGLHANLIAPPLHLCSDNAAMIAWAGLERLQAGLVDGLDFKARPRWPLDRTAQSG
jgi:N6-L-threonylcarbamoyladenine synthase